MQYSGITANSLPRRLASVMLAFFAAAFAARAAQGQSAGRIAVVDPKPAISNFAEKISHSLSSRFRVIDADTADVAFRSAAVEEPFNLSVTEAKRLADTIGCNYLVIVRTGVQPRQNIGRPLYVEAYAALFLIEGRSGRLRKFLLYNAEADANDRASSSLSGRAEEIAAAVSEVFLKPAAPAEPALPFLPLPDTAEAKNLQPPAPYRRIKPEYPMTAFLYSVQASVEIEADIDENGRVGNTAVVRWAGFGLEEAVEKAVREMNWRPAYRAGKPLAARVLLRYNFRKPAKDEEP